MQGREQSSTKDLVSATGPLPTSDSASDTESVSTILSTLTASFTVSVTSSSEPSATSTSVAASASNSGYSFASGGGLAVTLILLFFVAGAGIYFGYMQYLQYTKRHLDSLRVDQEKPLCEGHLSRLGQAQPQVLSQKGPTSFDDIVVLDGQIRDKSSSVSKASSSSTSSSDDAQVRRHHPKGTYPAEITLAPLITVSSRTPQQTRLYPARRPRRPANLNLSSLASSPDRPIACSPSNQRLSPPSSVATRPRPSKSMPLPYPSFPVTPPVPQRSPHRPKRPSRLSLLSVNRYSPHNSSLLSGRSLLPDASSAELMNHPAVRGRRLSDLSPGLDPDYAYPMTPAQIGDGRSLEGLGRREGGETVEGRILSEAKGPIQSTAKVEW